MKNKERYWIGILVIVVTITVAVGLQFIIQKNFQRDETLSEKPIIYLYPEQVTEIMVKMHN